MLKIGLLVITIGCTSGYAEYAKAPQQPKIAEVCYKGVVYIYLDQACDSKETFAITAKMNKDSEVVTCKSEGFIDEW